MHGALVSTFLSGVLALAPAAPMAAPSPTGQKPLTVIGRVRVTTTLCRALLGDARQAVQLETDNDGRVGSAVATLRTNDLDLDSSMITKTRGAQELTRQFVALRAAAGRRQQDHAPLS